MKTLFRSFAGGEITPELFGRVELSKFQTGLRLCRNFITVPHGPAARRKGTRFIARAKYRDRKVRLLPYVFDVSEALVIEMGHQYMRFHTRTGTVLEGAQTIASLTNTNPCIVGVGSGDLPANGEWVFLFGLPDFPALNNRPFKVANRDTMLDTFELHTLDDVPVDNTGTDPYVSGGEFGVVYEIPTTYSEDDIFTVRHVQSEDVITLTHPLYPAAELVRTGATSWTLTDIDFSLDNQVAAPTGTDVTATIAQNQNLSPHEYAVTALLADGVTESRVSASDTANNNLTLAGNFNTITWNAVAGADRYNVYKRRGVFAFVGQTDGLSFIDDNIIPDTTKTPPDDDIDLNGAAGEYPRAAAYHEQRRWFAGTIDAPQTIWATRSGTEINMAYSVPTQDDDSLFFRVRATNAVRHLMPLQDLLALTAGGEWRIYSDNEPAITPFSLTVKSQGFTGAANVQPVQTSSSILYVQAQGARIRELSYSWEDNRYRSVDIAIMAPHLFDGRQTTDLAFSRAPEQILWVIRDDGVLLGLTYVPEHQVSGWHRHDTQGAFESVAVIPELATDVPYFVVKREDALGDVRFIERLPCTQFRGVENIEDAYFVDAGAQYVGAPTDTVTGLWHLEGLEVQILADGAVEPPQVVQNGQIELDFPASKVAVGLQYVSDLETLPIAVEQIQAAAQGMHKNVTRVYVRVSRSSLLQAGPGADDLTPYPARAVSDPFDSPPALRTEELSFTIGGSWDPDGSVFIRQDQPVPLTVVALALEVEDGG